MARPKGSRTISPAKWQAFQWHLEHEGSIPIAAKKAGISESAVRSRIGKKPDFRAMVDLILEDWAGKTDARFLEWIEKVGTPMAAASKAGVSLDWVERRMEDPAFAERVQAATIGLVTGILDKVVTRAQGGDWKAQRYLLDKLGPGAVFSLNAPAGGKD